MTKHSLLLVLLHLAAGSAFAATPQASPTSVTGLLVKIETIGAGDPWETGFLDLKRDDIIVDTEFFLVRDKPAHLRFALPFPVTRSELDQYTLEIRRTVHPHNLVTGQSKWDAKFTPETVPRTTPAIVPFSFAFQKAHRRATGYLNLQRPKPVVLVSSAKQKAAASPSAVPLKELPGVLHLPADPIPQPPPPPLYPPEVMNSYIVLYEHDSFTGHQLTLRLADGGFCDIGHGNPLKGECSAFRLYVPGGPDYHGPVVQVTLYKYPQGHPDHSKVKEAWRWPDHDVGKKVLEDRNLHDAITCLQWAVDGKAVPGNYTRGPEPDQEWTPSPRRDWKKFEWKPAEIILKRIPGPIKNILPDINSFKADTENRISASTNLLQECETKVLSAAQKVIKTELPVLDQVMPELNGELTSAVEKIANLNRQMQEFDLKSLGEDERDKLLREVDKLKENLAKLEVIQKLAVRAIDYAKKAKNFIDFRSVIAKLENLDKLLDELDRLTGKYRIPVFEIDTPLTFSCNKLSGLHFAEMKLPQGMSYDYEKLKNTLNGKGLSRPNVDWVRCSAEIVAGVKLEFVGNRETFLKGQPGYYFSSERWCQYASPETALSSAVGIFSGGAKDVAAEFERQCRLEIADILSWATLEGESNLEPLARGALQQIQDSIKSGKPPAELPIGNIKLKGQEVIYSLADSKSSQAFLGGLLNMSFIQAIQSQANAIQSRVQVPHLGFSLQLNLPEGKRPLNETRLARLKQFLALLRGDGNNRTSERIRKIAQEATDAVFGKAKGQSKIVSDLLGFEDFDLIFDQLIAQIDVNNPQFINDFSFVIDLSKSALAKKIEAKAALLALGNEGKAVVEKLTLDLSTGNIETLVRIQHKHEWRGFKEAINTIKDTMAKVDAPQMLKDDAPKMLLEALLTGANVTGVPPELLLKVKDACKYEALRDGVRNLKEECTSLLKKF